jgi:hypothetical protein
MADSKTVGEDLDKMLVVSDQISSNMNMKLTTYGMEMVSAIEALPPEHKLAVEKQMNAIVESMTLEQRTKYLQDWKVTKEEQNIEMSINNNTLLYTNIRLAATSLLKWLQQFEYFRLFGNTVIDNYDLYHAYRLNDTQFVKVETIWHAPLEGNIDKITWMLSPFFDFRAGDIDFYENERRDIGYVDLVRTVKNMIPNEHKGEYQLTQSQCDELLGPRVEINKLNLSICMEMVRIMYENRLRLFVCYTAFEINIKKFVTDVNI